MTYHDDFTLSEALLGQLTADGLEALPTLFQALLNAAMQIERQKHLGAAPHERTQERTGHANGYKDKTLNTRLGQITVAVPQVREVNGQGGGFYPQSLDESLPEGLTVLAFPEPHRRLLRTTNGVERVSLIKPKPRNKAAHAGGEYLPERSVLPAFGECAADGDQRRLAGGQSLFDVHGTTHEITNALGCSQLLQKELDTILRTHP